MAYHGLALVTILALIEYSVLGFMVGRARQQFGIAAPATTGNPDFERYFRVHQNTLESLAVFIPSLWIFGTTVSNAFAVALGLLFIAGRGIYASGYIKDPAKREPGAIVTFAVNGILTLGSLIALIIKVL
ncbi:MAG TPA: MAPEG family protein [Candidatus Binataceae bacterium]|nr:MAPEG family protein [Candidatus Binataceae bacterium]